MQQERCGVEKICAQFTSTTQDKDFHSVPSIKKDLAIINYQSSLSMAKYSNNRQHYQYINYKLLGQITDWIKE